MPVYNDGDTVEKAVLSILDQDLPDIEIICVNDGSTDKSKEVLEMLKEKHGITVVHFEKNKGACVARNTGAKKAKGKYLSFLPADAILYPGMARIWYENLEQQPDYDFLYGGYRLIDDEGEPLEGHEYFFNPFDPYLLEVTNYIDGSFPIKTESFWKYAKIMGQKDGLWDKKIKSLQDWDFWLSVVKNGGNGLYIQDICFGTTAPHPGGLSYDSAANWIERCNTIKKKHGIPLRKLCVSSLGASWHAKRIAYILNADFKEMPSYKPHIYDAIYVIGYYPEFAAMQDRMFFNSYDNPKAGITAAKKIVHFVGSDIWQLYHCSLMSLKVWQHYFKNNVSEVLCEADFTQKELKELGIEAKVVPIPPAKLYDLMDLPKEFTIAVYQPKINESFYRPQDMRAIAKELPDIKFKFFGNQFEVGMDKELANIEHCGYINNMETFIKECSAIIRFPQHDGLPLSVLEFLLAGRYSIQSVPIEHAVAITNFSVKEVVEAIKLLKPHTEQHGTNKEASDYWRKELDHEKYKKTIYELAGYEPKTYWEGRARSWSEQASAMPIEIEEVKKMFEKTGAKSVLDIGCGDGRWYPHLTEWGVTKYAGIDISENLIKAAERRFPHLKGSLHATKVEDIVPSEEKFDLIFSYTCLEHIKEEDFEKAVKAIKGAGKQLLLIEPTDFISRYYCHNHSYKDYFKVILDEFKLADKMIYLCDLQ